MNILYENEIDSASGSTMVRRDSMFSAGENIPVIKSKKPSYWYIFVDFPIF